MERESYASISFKVSNKKGNLVKSQDQVPYIRSMWVFLLEKTNGFIPLSLINKVNHEIC